MTKPVGEMSGEELKELLLEYGDRSYASGEGKGTNVQLCQNAIKRKEVYDKLLSLLESGQRAAEMEKALVVALDSYGPISKDMSKLADEYDDGGEPEYPNHPLHDMARSIDGHIMGTLIHIEEILGGDPMKPPEKIDELRERVAAREALRSVTKPAEEA